MTSEEWLPVPGYRDKYQVSNLGRVRATTPAGPLVMSPMRVARNRKYLGVRVVRLDGRRITTSIHKLVMLAFVGPRPRGQEVRHLNGDASDNRLSNLRYGSHSENMRDSVNHGTHNFASRTHCKSGHEFTPENTSTSQGFRRCKTCMRGFRAAYKARVRQKAVA